LEDDNLEDRVADGVILKWMYRKLIRILIEVNWLRIVGLQY